MEIMAPADRKAKHAKVLDYVQQSRLRPMRNIEAMRVWASIMLPVLVPIIDGFVKDATVGNKHATKLIMFMMSAFAAGRAYQEANPDAKPDPDGYND